MILLVHGFYNDASTRKITPPTTYLTNWFAGLASVFILRDVPNITIRYYISRSKQHESIPQPSIRKLDKNDDFLFVRVCPDFFTSTRADEWSVRRDL